MKTCLANLSLHLSIHDAFNCTYTIPHTKILHDGSNTSGVCIYSMCERHRERVCICTMEVEYEEPSCRKVGVKADQDLWAGAVG